MRAPARSTLVPFLAFGLTLAAAIGLSVTAGTSAQARLHERVTTYLAALEGGDATGAAALRRDGDPRTEVERAAAARGHTWRVSSIALDDPDDDEPRSARVTVVWMLGPGREVMEQEVWVRDDDGPWTFWALDGSPPGGRR